MVKQVLWVLSKRPTGIVSSLILGLMADLGVHWSAMLAMGWAYIILEWHGYVVDCMLERATTQVVLKPMADPWRLLRQMQAIRATIAYLSFIPVAIAWLIL